MLKKMNPVTPINNFDFNGNDIFTIEIDNKVWFWGKQVAILLNYRQPNKAVNDHIKPKHRKTLTQSACSNLGSTEILWNGNDHSAKTLIDIPGIYSLVLRSALPQAEDFQDWVTDEVLPSIQKTGGYQAERKPLTLDEQLSVISKASLETRNAVKQHTKEINELKENQTINPGEYSYLNRLVSKKVYEYAKNSTINFSKKQIGELFKDISNGIKQVSNIRTRSQIRSGQYNSVIDYVCAWVPSVATVQVVKNMQLDLEG